MSVNTMIQSFWERISQQIPCAVLSAEQPKSYISDSPVVPASILTATFYGSAVTKYLKHGLLGRVARGKLEHGTI